MGQTNSRLVGAYAARDRRAVNLQQQHFRTMSRKLRGLAAQVRRATPGAAKSLVEYQKRLSPGVLQESSQLLTHDSKVRGGLQKSFLGAGGTATAFESLLGQVATPEFTSLLSRPEPLIFGFARSAEAVDRTAAASKPAIDARFTGRVEKKRQKKTKR